MERRDEERRECPCKSGEEGTEKERGRKNRKNTVEEAWATVEEGLGEGYWKGKEAAPGGLRTRGGLSASSSESVLPQNRPASLFSGSGSLRRPR